MQVLLTTLNSKYIHTNLAIRLLYELNKNKHDLNWKEFTIKEDPDTVAEFCARYDVVALSCYIWNITPTLLLTQKIKAKNPATKILLGGPEVSYEYGDVIARPDIDYIIAGEGEIAFADFLNNFPYTDNVHGLIYKSGNVVKTNPAPPMFDLKELENVMPYLNDAPEELWNKVLYMETSRGCPYKCEFCLASLDNKVRYLPNHSIKQTLLHLMQHGRVIKFLDRTFNIKRDFTLDIFQFILDNHRPGNVFQFEITADILHADIIKFINDKVPKGLFRFEIGIQTVNQQANLQVSRKQNFEKTKGIIQQLDHKVEMHLDLIVGLALDYWEDIKFSFEEVFKLFAPELQLGFLKFLKGTPVRDKHNQHGFVFDPQPPYQIIRSNYLSEDQLHSITQLEHALEIYWNGKKAVNTLKYVTAHYSVFDFLLGLGKYFGTIRAYHKYSLNDVFEIIMSYSRQNHPHDQVLQELIGLDYYLHFKVRPQPLFGQELEKTERNALIQASGMNHTDFRYVVLPFSFDLDYFLKTNSVRPVSENVFVRYDGKEKAKLVRPDTVIA